MKEIILASKSPYRKELLERLGIKFKCIPSDFDESELKKELKDPTELSQKLSFHKAQSLQKSHPESLIIGSDQVCYFKDKFLSKTGSKALSIKQLDRLQGSVHYLYTSYCILYENKKIHHTNVTRLSMKPLSLNQLKSYVETDNPIDCAGSYKLEKNGISLMNDIETTDSTAIVGLPLIQLSKDLEQFGIMIPPAS